MESFPGLSPSYTTRITRTNNNRQQQHLDKLSCHFCHFLDTTASLRSPSNCLSFVKLLCQLPNRRSSKALSSIHQVCLATTCNSSNQQDGVGTLGHETGCQWTHNVNPETNENGMDIWVKSPNTRKLARVNIQIKVVFPYLSCAS